jgi:hypothetical protein
VNRQNASIALAWLVCCTVLLSCCSGGGEKASGEVETDISAIMLTAKIYPDPAYSNNRLEVKFDVDYRMELPEFVYTWMRNGAVIHGHSESTLGPEHFTKGDEISVEIAPLDPMYVRRPFRTGKVKIRNSPPKMLEASLALSSVEAPSIVINSKYQDADNDRIDFSYRWYKNGEMMEDQASPTLDPAAARRGDVISVDVTASDGENTSPPLRTGSIEIQNHAPRITSSPPTSSSKDRFIYQVLCNDPDGDDLSYELLSAPEGMSIDTEGKIEWLIPRGEERRESYEVGVRVKDEFGGEMIQKFTFSVVAPKAQE